MKAFWIILIVLGLCAEYSASAGYCTWVKRREYVRYQFEKTMRQRFSKQINRKIQEFLDSLSDSERAQIRDYGSPESDRAETLSELRRRLDLVVDGFNAARCSQGKPVFEEHYPSKNACLDEDGSIAYRRPNYYRGLRLYADPNNIFIEGEIRQESRGKWIRSHGDFEPGDYLVWVTLGSPEEERRQIASTAAEFNFSDFDDFLQDDAWIPGTCKVD